MAETHASRRAYNSPRRQQQAAATRRAILEAAERLFLRGGYPATTMEAIAAEAGVSLKRRTCRSRPRAGTLAAKAKRKLLLHKTGQFANSSDSRR